MGHSKHYVYILHSISTDSYTVGSSHSLLNCTKKSNSSHSKNLLGQPWKLAYFEEFLSKEEASIRKKSLIDSNDYFLIKHLVNHN